MVHYEVFPTVEKAIPRLDYLAAVGFAHCLDYDEDGDQFILVWTDSVKETE